MKLRREACETLEKVGGAADAVTRTADGASLALVAVGVCSLVALVVAVSALVVVSHGDR